jgi:RNA polymerase sigma factor (sigma-70 family)
VLTGVIESTRLVLGIGTVTPRILVGAAAGFFVAVILAVLILRKRVLANRASRHLSYVLVASFGGVFLHRLLGLLMGASAKMILIGDHVVAGLVTAILSVTTDRRMAWSSLWFWVTGFALARVGRAGDHLHQLAMAAEKSVAIGHISSAAGLQKVGPSTGGHLTEDHIVADWARAAAAGDRDAATRVLEEVHGPIYRLSLRMLGHPQDAEDAAQEILLVVLTHLGSFRGESTFRTWWWRVATNHLLRVRKGRMERVTFDSVSDMLGGGMRDEAPDFPAAELALYTREVRLRCTEALLLSLDRELRITFVLGEILALSGEEAAAVLEIDPATYRKRLSRARQRLLDFLRPRCGIYDPANRCRCEKQVSSALERGQLVPGALFLAHHPARKENVARCSAEVDELMRVADVLRHPEYTAPPGLLARVRELLVSDSLELLRS